MQFNEKHFERMPSNTKGGKIWALLTESQRRGAVLLVGLMFVGMFAEAVGITMIVPVTALLTQPNLTDRFPAMTVWLERAGNPRHELVVIYGMLALVLVYVTKALFLSFLAWKQTHYVFRLQADLAQRLLQGYLRRRYSFHLQRNSAELLRNIFQEINIFTFNCLIPGLSVFTEVLVVFGISVIVFVYEPAGALLVAGILIFCSWTFHQLSRRRISRWGEARQFHEGRRMQYATEGLSGIKDIKLLGREESFLARFRLPNSASAQVARLQATTQQLPRLWLEVLAILGLAALVVVITVQGEPMTGLLTRLGLFAVAAFRILPSTNRIISGVQSVRYGLPAIETLHREIARIPVQATMDVDQRLPFHQTLVVQNVNYKYPGSDTFAVQNVTLRIEKGSSIGIFGESGSGKSTFADLLIGLLAPAGGSILVDGTDIQLNLRAWQDQIGYVPQSIYLIDDTLRRNVAFGRTDEDIDDDAVRRAIRDAQLEEFVNELSLGLDTVVGERGVRLSGGQRQRVGIARALYHQPNVLVLDEATSSLDIVTEAGLMESVRRLRHQKTMIIVAHRLSTLRECDRMFRMDKGGRLVEIANRIDEPRQTDGAPRND